MMDGPMTEMEEAVSGLLKQKEQARMDKIKEDNSQLKKYITRGGFIQDCNGRWCKEGDKVVFFEGDKAIHRVNLVWLENNGMFQWVETHKFKLVEPCEPDICKDFEGAN